jgi:hypothetical protein
MIGYTPLTAAMVGSPETVKASYAAHIAAKAVPVIPLSQYAYPVLCWWRPRAVGHLG